MPGAKGRSGGARPGAGPKPKSFTLKADAVFTLARKTPEGVLPLATVQVTEVERGAVTLTIVASNGNDQGDTLTLIR